MKFIKENFIWFGLAAAAVFLYFHPMGKTIVTKVKSLIGL